MVLFEKARQIGFSDIGLNQKGPLHKRFVHLDTVDRRASGVIILIGMYPLLTPQK